MKPTAVGAARRLLLMADHGMVLSPQECADLRMVCAIALDVAGSHGTNIHLTATTKWDRDERGEYPEAELTDYPEWMSMETVRAIENDIMRKMWRDKK